MAHVDLDVWVADHWPGDLTGKCAEVTAALVEAYPELRRVRGHYWCSLLRESFPHWWTEWPDRQIFDPTRDQYPSRGDGIYTEHEGPEPTGRCPNCGGYIYGGGQVCSDRCAVEYAAYCLNPD